MNNAVPTIPPHMLDADGRVAIDVGCPECGANLKAISAKEQCPECKTDVADSLSLVLDGQARLIRETPCLRCGYNLYMQPYHADCPECGAPVRYTLRGRSLQFADPTWINKLSTGMLLLALGGLFAVIAAASMYCTIFIEHFSDYSFYNPANISSIMLMTILAGASLLAAALILPGAALATSPEKTPWSKPKDSPARLLCRCGIFVICGVITLLIAAQLMNARFWSFSIDASVGCVCLVAIVAFPISLMLHLRTLLKRIPCNRKADAAMILAIAYGILWPLMLLAPICGDQAALIFFLPIFACCLFMLRLIYKAHKLFRQAARQARENADA